MTNFTRKNNDGNSIAWRDKATYGAAIIRNYIDPLEEAARESGCAPVDLQRSVLLSLQGYFATDMRERAPTVIVNEPMAAEFHELVRRVMEHIDVDVIASLEQEQVDPEVMHALLSYKGLSCYSPVVLDAYDHDQGLVRLTYYLHGTKPGEVFLIDGQEVKPAYSKYRGCRFFRRMLMRQRIVWLPASQHKSLTVMLDDKPVETALQLQSLLASGNPAPDSGEGLILKVRAAYPPGQGPRQALPFNLAGLKARVVRWLACTPFIRRKYGKAWVFMDRWEDADDSAEHLYRWVRENHPEINAWFLLALTSHDWDRLAREGFRLVPPGLQRKLLLLNSENIISSHAELMTGSFDPRLYGDLMRWRSIFTPHGISLHDVSHWLNNHRFDLLVSSSPAEYASIVDDDTPYMFTRREMRYTGLPRQDRLLRYAADKPSCAVNALLVMPTWRAGLVDGRSNSTTGGGYAKFADSEYAKRWRAFLGSDELRRLADEYEKKIVFLPHPNAAPFISEFSIPNHVKIADISFGEYQEFLTESLALITDYTSVAFEMAFIRRPTFYYHFDREEFYGGGHNWREGYFNYDRDGFGPVAFEQDELIRQIRVFLENGAKPAPEYLARMEKAMPERDGQSCKRVYENIIAIRKPFVAPAPTRQTF